MLHFVESGHGEPTIVLMHFYGGSHREWDLVIPELAKTHLILAVDTPGYGGSRDVSGYTIQAMVDTFEAWLSSLQIGKFILVGHSMTGKVALVLAGRKPAGLQALVLVTPSPLSFQPMQPGERETMRTQHNTRASAEKFIDGVTLHRLPDALREPMIESAIKCSPEAWLTWPDNSSKEDWSELVGVVDYPTLVVAGAEDPSLPAPIQETLTMPHLSNGRLEIVEQTGHLIPLEQPARLSRLILDFADAISGSNHEEL